MKPREIILAVIVAVLLALVAFGWFQSRQRDVSGVAGARNLQQWGIALNLYLIDNDKQLPSVGGDPITPEQTTAWYNALPPYISQTPLADLPDDQRPRPGDGSLWIDPGTKPPRIWDNSVFVFNYGMNRYLQPDKNLRSYKVNELHRPGNVIFLTEVDGYNPDATPDTVVFRNGKTANVLFCDGHVAPVSRSVLVDDPATRLSSTVEEGISWFAE
jgi:hypothetical protein